MPELTGTGYKLTGQTRSTDAENREHEADMYAKRVMDMPSNQQLRVAYDGDNNPIYVGVAPSGLESSSGGWMISKFTWSSGNMTLRQTGYGAWDNRATTVTYS